MPQTMSFDENGERCSMYFLQARTQEDLRRRTRAHRMIADMSHGLFGRSPDHFSSFVTGDGDECRGVQGRNASLFRESARLLPAHPRATTIYVAYAVLPPQAARDPEFYQRQNLPVPTLEWSARTTTAS